MKRSAPACTKENKLPRADPAQLVADLSGPDCEAALDGLAKLRTKGAVHAAAVADALRAGNWCIKWKALKALRAFGSAAMRPHAQLIISQVDCVVLAPSAKQRHYLSSNLKSAVEELGDAVVPYLGMLCARAGLTPLGPPLPAGWLDAQPQPPDEDASYSDDDMWEEGPPDMARELLGACRKRAIGQLPAYAAGLKNSNYRLRKSSLQLLSGLSDGRGANAALLAPLAAEVLALLQDPHEEVRCWAVQVLADFLDTSFHRQPVVTDATEREAGLAAIRAAGSDASEFVRETVKEAMIDLGLGGAGEDVEDESEGDSKEDGDDAESGDEGDGEEPDDACANFADLVPALQAPSRDAAPKVRHKHCLDLARFLAKVAEGSPSAYLQILGTMQRLAAPHIPPTSLLDDSEDDGPDIEP